MSEAILSLALRPKGLSSLIGQKVLVDALRKQMATRPPQAIMLTGNSGCGKTSLGRIIALSLQCTHQTTWGDPCQECQKKAPGWINGEWGEYSVHEINASETGGVEEIGKVSTISRYLPLTGKRRVIILDEMQRSSSASQNLLLKPTEHPPSTTTWILATTEPQKILLTLRRRFIQYQLKGLSSLAMEALLKRASKHCLPGKVIDTAPLVSQLEQQGISSSALILMAFEKYISGFSAEDSVASTEGTAAATLGICKAMSGGQSKELRKLLQSVTPEEARWVRASAIGWLRGMFWREADPNRLMAIADSLQDLASGTAPLEDSLLLPWVIAGIYKTTKRFVRRS